MDRLAILRSACIPVAGGFLDLVLPRVCLLCERLLGEQHGLVCGRCWLTLPVLPRPACDRCGHPTYGRACRWCSLLPERIVGARSVCWVPDGLGGELVHKLKYGGWVGLGDALAERIVRLGRPWRATEYPLLVPVPLGAGRLRERGFNQSAVLACALARRWRVRVDEGVVVRARETESQVRLTPAERSANVHNAFVAGPAARVARGAHVVLVDDVVTTAATLNACAAAAFAAGAITISYVTFGRARAAFDRTANSRS